MTGAAAHAARALEVSGVDAKAVLKKPIGLYADTRRGKVTVNGYAPVYLEQAEIRDTSRESYDAVMRKHVIGHLGDVPMTELTPVMVREFLVALKRKGVSAATRGSALKVLRAMCQAAVQDELLTRNPTAGMKVSDQQAAERQVLTPAEADRLLDAIPRWARLLVKTALDTGCRWGELLAIRPDDVVQGVDGVWPLRIRRTMEEVGSKLTERSPGCRAEPHKHAGSGIGSPALGVVMSAQDQPGAQWPTPYPCPRWRATGRRLVAEGPATVTLGDVRLCFPVILARSFGPDLPVILL